MRALIVLFLLGALPMKAQDVFGFLDRRGHLMAFDRGTISEIEARKPMSFKNGGNALAYVTQSGALCVVREGRRDTIDRTTAPITFTDHLLGYVDGGRLKVFDGLELRTLCATTNGAIIEDSVAAWYDASAKTLNAFHRGKTFMLESEGASEAFKRMRGADDLLAWTDGVGALKVLFRGAVHVLAASGAGTGFRCGAGVVAFEDPLDHGFKAFGASGVQVIEAVMPVHFVVGQGIVAYMDRDGALKLWQGGVSQVLRTTNPPDEFFVHDAMVVIVGRDGMSAHVNGQDHSIASPAPSRWVASRGAIAWEDSSGVLWLWRGNAMRIMEMPAILDLRMERGTPLLEDDRGTTIFWNGRLYEP